MSVLKVMEPKDPAAKLDYSIDWTEWLETDTIAASEWTVPAGLTKESQSFLGAVCTVVVSGGKAGRSYRISNLITTASVPPRVNERTLEIPVEER